MNITKQEKDYKEFLALEKRYNELWEQLRKRNWIPLPEPIQKGWEISFVLRDDIKRRKDAPEIQQALDLVQHSFRTRDLKLVKQVRSIKSFKKVVKLQPKKKYGIHIPSLCLISEATFKNLNSNISCFFEVDPENEKWKSFRGSKYYLSIPHYWLELKARLYWLKYGTNYSTSYPAYKDRAITRDKIQKFKKGEIDDIINEKIPKEYDY